MVRCGEAAGEFGRQSAEDVGRAVRQGPHEAFGPCGGEFLGNRPAQHQMVSGDGLGDDVDGAGPQPLVGITPAGGRPVSLRDFSRDFPGDVRDSSGERRDRARNVIDPDIPQCPFDPARASEEIEAIGPGRLRTYEGPSLRSC
ncbi:hypothetical protein GCM10023237_61410 [Streptomyces coeruleoprunus]